MATQLTRSARLFPPTPPQLTATHLTLWTLTPSLTLEDSHSSPQATLSSLNPVSPPLPQSVTAPPFSRITQLPPLIAMVSPSFPPSLPPPPPSKPRTAMGSLHTPLCPPSPLSSPLLPPQMSTGSPGPPPCLLSPATRAAPPSPSPPPAPSLWTMMTMTQMTFPQIRLKYILNAVKMLFYTFVLSSARISAWVWHQLHNRSPSPLLQQPGL